MAVIHIHTGVPTSPKHAPLSDAAFRLWTHALCWSKEHLTDGFIPAAMLLPLHPKGPKVVAELLASIVLGKGPLWHEVEGGYQVHDYAEWQETKARVQDRRQQWRDRQSRSRVNPSVTPPPVTPSVTAGVTRDTRVSHAESPSDGSGSGSGLTDPLPNGRVSADADVQALFDAWNTLTTPPLPRCRELTKDRRIQIRRRLKERPLADWLTAMRKIEASAFCRGESDRGKWRADLDWLIANTKNIVKVVEGRYDDIIDDVEPDDPAYDLSKPYVPKLRPSDW